MKHFLNLFKEFLWKIFFWNGINFFMPISDKQATTILTEKYGEAEARRIVDAWRSMAKDMKYPGKIAFRVLWGFIFRKHAPSLGPCFNGLKQTQQDDLRNDESTENSVLFFIPKVLEESRDKNETEQRKLLSDLRIKYNLPSHHLGGFGQVGYLVGVILTLLKITGDYVVPEKHTVRTDTLYVLHNKYSEGETRTILISFERFKPSNEAVNEAVLDITPFTYLEDDRWRNLVIFPHAVEIL